MQRRTLIAGALGLPVAAALWQFTSTPAQANYSPVCSAANNAEGQPILGAMHGDHWAFTLPGEERGHDSCVHNEQAEALFFARRPGTHIYVVDLKTGKLRHKINAAEGYHFYGHGCVSGDGRYLYTTENHVADDGRGVIGVYDCYDQYRLISHMDCGGIGPHELALMPDGKHIVVAVGGIKTLPASGRKTLNPGALEPGLSYLNLAEQRVVAFIPSPDAQLSLRHLDVNTNGDVVVGGQYQGTTPSAKPLIYHHRLGSEMLALDINTELAMRNDYVASVATDDQQNVLCSFPRDNQLGLWSIPQRRLLHSWRLRDCAGAVYDAANKQFIVSSSSGQLMAARAGEDKLSTLAYLPGLRWDNHLSLIPPHLAKTLG